MKASRDVHITPADNGVIIRVGCKLLVFTKREQSKFLVYLDRYLNGEEDKLREELFPEDAPQPPLEPANCYVREAPQAGTDF